jgi:hypothetical protein
VRDVLGNNLSSSAEVILVVTTSTADSPLEPGLIVVGDDELDDGVSLEITT